MHSLFARLTIGSFLAIVVCIAAGCGGVGAGEGGGCGYLACDVRFGIAAADFNGDGLPDLAIPITQVAHSGGSSMDVYLQLPSGSSRLAPSVSYPLAHQGWKTIATDIDGDGRPDILTVDLDSNAIAVLLNQPDKPGTFTLAPTIAAGDILNDVTVADINGDGRVDLITANGDGSESAADGLSIHLQLAQTPGEFAPATFIPIAGCCDSVAVGDVNGDGLPDLVAVGVGSGVVVLLQIPGQPGAFESPARVVAGPASYCVQLVDLNGDGLLDLVYGGQAGASGVLSSMRVALQDANNPGHFLPATTYTVLGGINTCLVHDLTGNHRPDIIVSSENGVSVLRQDPTHPGSFLAAANYAAGQIMYVAIADMNSDGLPDIVAAQGPSSSAPGVLYQDPAHSGTFGTFQNLQ